MIPIVLFIVALVIVLVTTFRRAGAMSSRNVLDVAIGFLGWFVINTLLWVWVINNESGVLILNPARLIPLLVNIPALLVLGFTRRWITLGILAAILPMRSGCCSSQPLVPTWMKGSPISLQ